MTAMRRVRNRTRAYPPLDAAGRLTRNPPTSSVRTTETGRRPVATGKTPDYRGRSRSSAARRSLAADDRTA